MTKHHNQDRVLTIRVTIKEPEKAKWLWDAYPNPINGVVVSALSNGDMFKERDTLASAAAFYIREEGETTEEAIEAHGINGGFDSPDEAASQAPSSVRRGRGWDVVDRHGNVLRTSRQETY